MQKEYRKKPVIVKAEQWFPGKNIDGVLPSQIKGGGIDPNAGVISTLEGMMLVGPGDYIITGIKGEKYPCKKEIFELTYEPVSTDGVTEAVGTTGLLLG